MNRSRKLTLKREALQELTSRELDSVAGAAPPTTQQTQYSCLDYISCWWFQCIPQRLPTVRDCIE